jgi:hypothetical protein
VSTKTPAVLPFVLIADFMLMPLFGEFESYFNPSMGILLNDCFYVLNFVFITVVSLLEALSYLLTYGTGNCAANNVNFRKITGDDRKIFVFPGLNQI